MSLRGRKPEAISTHIGLLRRSASRNDITMETP